MGVPVRHLGGWPPARAGRMLVTAMAEELLLTRFERAWNLHDHDGCAGCFVEDGVREFRVRRPCAEPGDPPRVL